MEKYRLAIRDLPLEERPRERLAKYGPEVLSTAELLAILLRTGSLKESALALAERLLAQFGSLKGIATASVEELSTVRGIGQVKAIEIRAAVELSKRLASYTEELNPTIQHPADVHRLLGPELRHEKREHMKALFLDTKGHVIRAKTISIGSLDESVVHPRELFREAISCSAASVIVAHNHPSGDPTPSEEDVDVSIRLREAGEIVGIDLLNHVVIADGKYISMKERRLF